MTRSMRIKLRDHPHLSPKSRCIALPYSEKPPGVPGDQFGSIEFLKCFLLERAFWRHSMRAPVAVAHSNSMRVDGVNSSLICIQNANSSVKCSSFSRLSRLCDTNKQRSNMDRLQQPASHVAAGDAAHVHSRNSGLEISCSVSLAVLPRVVVQRVLPI